MAFTISHRRTLIQELDGRADAHPDRTWLIFERVDESVGGHAESFTYAAFVDKVGRTARVLTELGLERGDKLMVVLGNCPEFLFLWFATASLGAIIVPANPASSDLELQYLCHHSESVLIAIAAPDVERARRLKASCAALREILVCGPPVGPELALGAAIERVGSSPLTIAARSDDVVSILYTSGTTSRPKGCLITNANYIHAGEAVAQHIGLTSADRHLVELPYFHGNAQYYSTMSALVAGASLVVTDRFSASRYFATAARHQATVASLFAAPMRMLLAQPDSAAVRDHALRLVIFAQNLTAHQLAQFEHRFHVSLLQIYGMTEQLGWPLANPLRAARDNMSLGRPTLPYQCRVVDDQGQDVPAGEAGQLLVKGTQGVSLMAGYFKDPDATNQVLRDGWLWTGDNVRERLDGSFEFVDRAKDMIKRAGENVAASEVEAVIKEHPAVFDAAVIGVPDPIRDEALKACVVLNDNASLSPDELIGWCAERLAKFRVPEIVEFRAELPRTSVGKIQKHILRAESASPTP